MDVYVCCHSYSALYLLYCINHNKLVKGFIGIDPTSAKIMSVYSKELHNNLQEALRFRQIRNNEEKIDVDTIFVNPLMGEENITKCKKLYAEKYGNDYEISELEFADDTLAKTEKMSLSDDIPSLCFISSLNKEDYDKYGNPYCNNNNHSKVITLEGHHFLHWLKPDNIADEILLFINNN